MKKRLFLLATTALLLFSGLAFFACDDDDSSPAPAVGSKKIEVRVIDEAGSLTTADVSIKKDGTAVNSVLVAGSYTLNVAGDKSGTVFTFKASRNGYVASSEQSVTLTYSDPSESFSSYVVLQITKQSSGITLDPTKDNSFVLPSNYTPGGQIKVSVPAGTFDKVVTLNATSVPTAASRGEIDSDAPNGSFALQIIEFASNWEGNFLNGNKVTFEFPLTQDLIDATVKNGATLLFGTTSSGKWESYPIMVNEAAKTGTVSIPHFSTWYLATSISVDVSSSQSPMETLATGACGENVTATFSKTNPPVPDFYKKVFGWTSFPNVSQTNTETGVADKYWVVRGRSFQRTVSIEGLTIPVPSYTYFKTPVSFTSTAISCAHSGGGGQ